MPTQRVNSLTPHGIAEESQRRVWTAIAPHTTPSVPEHMAPEVALVTAGVETDILGIGYQDLDQTSIQSIVSAHPRPNFKLQILEAFTNGFRDRPDTAFGTVNANVLARFSPGFVRTDFVTVIEQSAWPE